MLPLRMLALILMVLLCDADTTCPGDDFLTLDPPEVIGEYEDDVMVNCSTVEFHDGIYWTDGTKKIDEGDDEFITLGMKLSNWTIKAECVVKLNDTAECRRELEVTVYKNPDVDVYPLKHLKAAVEGTEYQLQCDIFNVAPVRNLVVKWYKDNQLLKTDTYNKTTEVPVNESSMLAVNISRGENQAQFTCEAQLDFGPHGPKPNSVLKTYTVPVHYPPKFNSNTTYEEVHVEEGDNVTLSCEAESNPPPHFHWTCDGVNMTENLNSLYFLADNDKMCTCIATNTQGAITKEFIVTVEKENTITPNTIMPKAIPGLDTSAPTVVDCPLTLTPTEIVVKFGDPASINCSTTETDAVGMGWEAPYGGSGFKKVAFLTWKVEKLEDWTIELKCYITPKRSRQCAVIPVVTVYKTPDIVSVSAHGQLEEDKESELTCDVISVAPVQHLTVKWYRDNEFMTAQSFNDISKIPKNVTSTLRVTPSREHNGVHFRCSAELNLGPGGAHQAPITKSKPHTAVVHYKPLMQNCPGSHSGKENYFRIDMLPCKADGNPPPTIRWSYGGQQINTSEPLTRQRSGVYTATVENRLGKNTASVDITIEYSPSFNCSSNYEVVQDSELQTVQCVPEGVPQPTVTWFKDGQEMDPLQPLIKHHSGIYKLRATNKHGTEWHTLHLQILITPKFKEKNGSKEMSPGENVTIDCQAMGNPDPEIRLVYPHAVNVGSVTRGSQSSIIITEATSTNAGVYICVATNKVGIESRSVTLIMKGTRTGGNLPLIIVLIVLCLVFLVIIFFLCTKRKKHGQYTFVPNKVVASSEIPMTPKFDGMQA